jgi:DNA-binding response OmpR family regulator
MTSGRGDTTVLLVEDSEPVRELLAAVLRRGGHEVVLARGGEEGLAAFSRVRPDLVVLDLVLAGLSGWDVLRRLRERSDVPIVVVTGLGDQGSKIRALNAGADDYLVKPVALAELLARVGALLRRARWAQAAHPVEVYDNGAVQVDFDNRLVRVHGDEISLTPLEYRLLAAFVRRPGHLFSRQELLREVWHDTSGGPSDHVKIYVGYLRRKLSAVCDDDLIETVRGFGYRWPGVDAVPAWRGAEQSLAS